MFQARCVCVWGGGGGAVWCLTVELCVSGQVLGERCGGPSDCSDGMDCTVQGDDGHSVCTCAATFVPRADGSCGNTPSTVTHPAL